MPDRSQRLPALVLRLLASAAVSALIVALLLRLLPQQADEKTASVLQVLGQLLWPWLGVYLICQVAQTAFRAVRYGVLLRAAGEQDVPAFRHILLVTMARNMFVDLLPARAGELIYVGLLNRGYRMSLQGCLSSLAVSFVFDLLGLGVVFMLLLGGQVAVGDWSPLLAAAGAAFIALPLAALYLLYTAPHAVMTGLRARCGGLRWRIVARLLDFGDRIADAMQATRRARVFGRVLGLTLGVRFGKYAGLYAVFVAVTALNFPEMSTATPWKVLTAQLTAEAAASLPLPTLMSFGTYEAGGAMAWSMLGFSASTAVVVVLASHVCSQTVDYTLGGLGLLLFTLFGGRRRAAADLATPVRRGARPLAFAAALTALAAAGSFALWQARGVMKMGAVKPPPSGHDVTPTGAGPERLAGLDGFVVWSSNRGGNHDLWRMDLPSGSLRQLTRDPHVDTFPRIAPDGRRVVFARSRETWVSQRNPVPWDAWLLDLDTGRETRVAEFANAPSWVDDDTIAFQRNATQVVTRVLSTGLETVRYEAGRGEVAAGTRFENPSLARADGVLATALRGPLRATALVEPDHRVRIVGGGCQLTWRADGRELVMTDLGGSMKNAFARVDPATRQRTRLVDAAPPFSHEYFPRLTADGRVLVFGASTGGHEHDTADYEIFLWRVGEPASNAVRLTHHTGNDNWPDVFLK